jgi:hypothetical protein
MFKRPRTCFDHPWLSRNHGIVHIVAVRYTALESHFPKIILVLKLHITLNHEPIGFFFDHALTQGTGWGIKLDTGHVTTP